MLIFICIAAMHWPLSSAASLRSTQLEHNNIIKQSRLKDSGTLAYGYWLSYPGDECLKCNCSLNVTIKFQSRYTNYNVENHPTVTEFLTIFMNKSDCAGEASSVTHKCQCYGNPDFMIGQINQDTHFTGTMGDLNCFGAFDFHDSDFFAVTCQGQKRSETIRVLQINN